MKAPSLISHYCWILWLVFPVLFVLPILYPKRTKTFHSSPEIHAWNSSKNPIWFLHMSDLHLSGKRKSYQYIANAMNWSLGKFKPHQVVIAGDLTDNQGMEKVRPYRRQIEEDWNLYRELLAQFGLNNSNLVHTVGNHDVYSVQAFDSPDNYAKRYFPNISEFHMSVKFYEYENTKFKFVILNKYDFPSAPICFLQWSFVDAEFKKRLVDELAKDDCDISIVVSHNPALRYHTLSRFSKILENTHNTRFMLSGHWHPMQGGYLHFGDVLEVVSPPLFRIPRVGVVTFDNQRAVHTIIDMNDDVNAVMTNPVPRNQTSGRDVFNAKSSEIRAIGFSENELDLRVSGAVTGKLSRVRKLKDGVYLYSLPMTLPDGDYVLHREGDWHGSVEFTIGNTVKPFYEKPYMNRSSYGWSIVFIWMLLPALFLVIPVMPSALQGVKETASCFGVILRSFVSLKMRIMGLPISFRTLLLASMIVCLILPISMFDIQGLTCVFHLVGNFLGREYKYHYMGTKYGITYLFGMLYPTLNVINGIDYYRRNKIYAVIDALFICYGLYRWIYDFMWLFDMFGTSYAAVSPLMTVVPILLYGNLILWGLRCTARKEDTDDRELRESPLYDI